MNRRDFELLCRVFKEAQPPQGQREDGEAHFQWKKTVQKAADAFSEAEGCAGFDRVRFLKACGVAL